MARAFSLAIVITTAGLLISGPEARSQSPLSPHFSKTRIVVGTRPVSVEIADDDDKRAHGLMNRSSLGANEGMLFVFPSEARRSFWMLNTKIPLSIGYFDRDKKLLEVIDMRPDPITAREPKVYPSRTAAQYALEMNLGWFKKNKIRPGVFFRFADKPIGAP